ncbi:MAG: aldolase catalytic domain-containing protein [Lachnospiraceae bacterium]|nr:aldolase catalytic domain-containing protein [Lachnospiraceae bacterium]
MELKGSLLSVREDVRVLDATIRDGGLVNDFYFSDEFVKDLYQMNVKAGVDYMEFGYKASKDIFDTEKFGKWKFCDEDDLRAIVGDNNTNLKLSAMADVGRCDYKTDIINRSDSALDMIRVATYINTMPEALAMIEDAANKGYETTCNIMAISNCQEGDVRYALEELAKSPVDAIYIVDSYGSLYPEQMRRITQFYMDITDKYGKKIGIHAHNNQQCAFANTIEALSIGASFLDATVNGLGRGAGNCSLEGLIGFLKNPNYKLTPVLRFIEKQIVPLKESGVIWGYDIPYLLTGLLDQHPRTAIAATTQKNTSYSDFYHMLMDRD